MWHRFLQAHAEMVSSGRFYLRQKANVPSRCEPEENVINSISVQCALKECGRVCRPRVRRETWPSVSIAPTNHGYLIRVPKLITSIKAISDLDDYQCRPVPGASARAGLHNLLSTR
ncbi:hypothetical protein EVAR_5500_1 [Eumeta japonica]|uniref:Uncharacterized protein n=1 Tax=Eumeta variegata TaxID=151549 RepID=A0A4C1TBZ4_EUMVA|nr:hypothetical protein EVAR_5500_1 [Eumeta japonica]